MITRARISYDAEGRMVLDNRQPPGTRVDRPVAGFFRYRLRGGAITGVVRIWHGAPFDPVTGEQLDRSHRWQAEFNGEPIDIDRVWPGCAGEPTTETEYRRACARQDWARQNAPRSAYADPKRRHDPLSSDSPLPF